MEDLFGQIECRTKSDSIVMRILRSAMDEAHENLQSKDGPIQFLHDRSTFYELAAILVEGGLNIVQEETTDILEDNCNKILSDLMEIRDWLQGRIQDMKRLIVEKDRELTERLENELKLQQSLELKDREIFYLHEKLEPGRAKHEAIQDGATERDISKLKSSVDQQVSNIKQKLEDEKKILNIERRMRKTRVSSPNLSFEFLDMERNGSPIFADDDSLVTDRFSDVKPQSELSRPNNQNVLIRRMSSDMDVLKETLDLAFGRMLSAEALPLEKQWMCTIEKDIESILVKGFINDLKQSFDVELKKKVDSWFEFIDEMRTLCYELKDYFTINDVHEKGSITPGSSNRFTTERRWSSEPLPEFSYTKNPIEDDTEVEKSNHVAKMIKNHESIIRKQLEDWNLLKREGSMSSWTRRDKGNNRLEKKNTRGHHEAVKDSHVHLMESESLKQHDFQERTPRSRRLNADNSQEGTPRSRKLETEGDESLIQKLDSLLRCLEAEEDLMLRASSEIKEHNVNNSLVILNCEEIDERNAIEWLITDDESTFSSVSEKLERALQQLYTSKELLVELEQSLEVSDDELGENCCQMQLNNVLSTEHEKTHSLKDDQMRQVVPSDYVFGNHHAISAGSRQCRAGVT
ncbi:hypothetical protein DH2020_021645 [Rehmannia glutinosa]|uniref:Uncharacterized protein n=1 Tax=Rehmannia glutinosa TaxID=99300 RepID=A0ABR0WFC1_REHGL